MWQENLAAVEAFVAASTQWRAVAAGAALIYLGLDYAAARAGIEAAGITVTPELWRGVRIMEEEWRRMMNEANQ